MRKKVNLPFGVVNASNLSVRTAKEVFNKVGGTRVTITTDKKANRQLS